MEKINIYFKNGDVKIYEKNQYTDYKYCGEVFAIIFNNHWIGIYSMTEVRCIEVEVN